MAYVIANVDVGNDAFTVVEGGWLKFEDLFMGSATHTQATAVPRPVRQATFWITVQDGEVKAQISKEDARRLEERNLIASFWESFAVYWIYDSIHHGFEFRLYPDLELQPHAEDDDSLEQRFIFDDAHPFWKAAPMGGAFLFAAPTSSGAPVEEQVEFLVELTEMGDKIKTIKALREFLPLGISEAKALAESAPCVVIEGVHKEQAEDIKARLELAGASAAIK